MLTLLHLLLRRPLLRLRWEMLWLRSLLLMLTRLLLVPLEQLRGDGNPTTAELLSESLVIPPLLGGCSGVQCGRIGSCVSCASTSFPEEVRRRHVHVGVFVIAAARRRRSSCRRRRRAQPSIVSVRGVNALPSPSAGENMSFLHDESSACSRTGRRRD